VERELFERGAQMNLSMNDVLSETSLFEDHFCSPTTVKNLRGVPTQSAKRGAFVYHVTLTEDKVKKYLKKLNLNEYYDNVIAIINRLNKRPPFTLTTELEEKIKSMFRQIQEPFEKHKPKNRKNFLSYSYTLHKFFQILNLHEFCKYFPLLKSNDKLRQQDEIFKKIVAEMAMKDKTVNWVFYPSI
jgi:hypothetical protein